jgi:predicted glycosyltransferase
MFKYYIKAMESRGHQMLCIVNDKEMVSYFVDKYQLNAIFIGKNQPKIIGKLIQIPSHLLQTLKISLRFKPDLFIGQAFLHFAFASRILSKPFVILEDTEVAKALHKVVIPFSDIVFTTSYFQRNLGKKEVKLKCNYELLYLHPNYYVPDPDSLNDFGLKADEKYCLIRFVSWEAYHDIGLSGLSLENKIRAVDEFSKHCRVLISSEVDPPQELLPYVTKISPDKMHDLLYYASLYFGESATMAAESAVLGTPAIYLDEHGRGYTKELEEKFDLMFNYKTSQQDQQASILKGIEILKSKTAKSEWQAKRLEMLDFKIDINAFMIWFTENYPESEKMLRLDPGVQDQFLPIPNLK